MGKQEADLLDFGRCVLYAVELAPTPGDHCE